MLSGHGDIVASAAYSPDGSRIVTASRDKTAWIWDAAAETDPLPDVDRTQLGLLPDARVRRWGTEGSACDEAAAAFYDPDRLTAGLAQAAIVADVASSACSPQFAPSGHTPRLAYQAARALLAKSDVKGSRQQFELAVSAGHRAAARRTVVGCRGSHPVGFDRSVDIRLEHGQCLPNGWSDRKIVTGEESAPMFGGANRH